MSIVEALTVTGPVKPLLAFSALVRSGFAGQQPVHHTMMTTRRPTLASKPENDQLLAATRQAGVPLITIPERHPLDLGVLPRMRRGIEEARPELIETHDCKSHFLFYLLRTLYPRLRQCKWIAFHHGYTRTSWKVTAYQQLDRLTLRHADHVVTLCEPFAQMLSKRGAARSDISILTNFFAPRAKPPAHALARERAALHIAPSECVIICVGRLSSEKGHADLIAAFRAISKLESTPPLRLVLVGDGPERARLERLAASLGPKVILTGQVSDPWPLLNAADIFVLPSHSEGSPLVIFEAMAASLPIVATSVGGIPEALTNDADALLVAPSRPEALAGALTRLIRDDSLRKELGKAAFATLQRHSPSSYASRLLGVYGKVIGRPKPAPNAPFSVSP